MSIQSEITRITNKRDASFTAVANKGVTVPSGSTIDDLPSLIGAISTASPTYSITKSLTNVTSSNDDTVVLQGGSFFADLTPTSGYLIDSITVTMGGVDVTESVFKPGIGAKAITANGMYRAADDMLGGYSSVVVDVPPTSATLGTKTITENGTYSAASDSLDGYSSVTVSVSGGGSPNLQSKTKTYTPTTSMQTETVSADSGYDGLSSVGITVNPIPSEYIVPSGTKSITANGTGIDVAAYASVDVAVPTTGKAYATGTYTPDADKKSTANVKITDVATIGFTPTKFILHPTTKADVSGVQYAIIHAIYDSAWPIRVTTRYSNTSNTSSASCSQSAWTTQTNYYLYFNDNNVYIRTTSAFILKGGVDYTWEAFG